MVFANVRKVVRIVLPFDHFHTGPWCKAFACFASIMAFNLCPCGEGTGCSDRMSRRKTQMIVTASRSGLTELGPESGQREEASLSHSLSLCHSSSDSLSWWDNCPNGFLLRSEMSHKLKDSAKLSSELRLSVVFALNTICPYSERRLGPQ